ncbi:hypothetical protein FQN54_004954 [Arachnomyces sp. PD_36]|nr:hypothetical protein FQN54_004954 [Arachnomyces sp. PD_36]
MGWPTVDGNRTTTRLGENFILCSPHNNQVITCYPPGVDRVFRDEKNWSQPKEQSQLFAVYGENVLSTQGSDWLRHRKITASAFNENTVPEVWKESVKRATALSLADQSDLTLGGARSTFDVLAMQVLAVVGFGQDMSWTSVPPGHQESLMQSLGFILQHITLTILFSGLKAPDFLLPGVLRRLKVSFAEFKLYMEESVLHHIRLSHTSKSQPRSSLLGAMVRANEVEKKQLNKSTSHRSYLTDSELYGNIFVFNVAGYETTAATMTFALTFLATNQDIQNWVIEEVDKYYTNSTDHDYATTYPKLVRCLASMYEALRLASPGPLLLRSPSVPQEVPIITPSGETSLTVNPGTLVGAHLYGAHLSPRWGPDATSFNPKRFISTSAAGDEMFVLSEDALFASWMFGPRVCPGKKFSQVEFVGAVAQVLSEYRVEILRQDGESETAARSRLMGVLDEKFFNVSAHLRRPEDAGIRFVRRGVK